MRIAFVHDSKAFLPEVAAYTKYFSKLGFQCEVVSSKDLRKLQPDVAWHFMGMDARLTKTAGFVIHEYTSASMPPFADFKNKLKKFFNVKPNYRLFLNEYVKNSFAFTDNVPYGYRDMGVEQEWLSDVPAKKIYDFIYVGSLRNGIGSLFDAFETGAMKEHSLVVVADNYEKAQQECKKIRFVGPVPHHEVQELVRSARYAINFIPDVSPFCWQTSTKFLEYCACKVPVITTDYIWMWEFEEKYGGKYFYLESDFSNFSWREIHEFNYEFPDLTEWTWEKQIERSGIVQVLEKLR
jgi:hypothetical protein